MFPEKAYELVRSNRLQPGVRLAALSSEVSTPSCKDCSHVSAVALFKLKNSQIATASLFRGIGLKGVPGDGRAWHFKLGSVMTRCLILLAWLYLVETGSGNFFQLQLVATNLRRASRQGHGMLFSKTYPGISWCNCFNEGWHATMK